MILSKKSARNDWGETTMTERQLRRQRGVVLVFLYLLTAATGAYLGAASDPSRIGLRSEAGARVELLLSLGTCLGFTWFCTVDARLSGTPLLEWAKVGIFFGWPIAVPVYLLCTRGISGLRLFLLYGFLLLLVLVCMAIVVSYILFGEPFPA